MYYLSESIGIIGTRSVQKNRMEEHCVTGLHFQPDPVISTWFVTLYTMVHLVHSSLQQYITLFGLCFFTAAHIALVVFHLNSTGLATWAAIKKYSQYPKLHVYLGCVSLLLPILP